MYLGFDAVIGYSAGRKFGEICCMGMMQARLEGTVPTFPFGSCIALYHLCLDPGIWAAASLEQVQAHGLLP